jgi:Zn-finger nucleic acid-binding protein
MDKRKIAKSRKVHQPEPHPNAALVPEGERRCVICGSRMTRQFQEGVAVDVCEEHGIWLDKNQLPRIISRIRERGHEVRRAAMQRTYEEGKKEGREEAAWWGFWV